MVDGRAPWAGRAESTGVDPGRYRKLVVNALGTRYDAIRRAPSEPDAFGHLVRAVRCEGARRPGRGEAAARREPEESRVNAGDAA